MAARRTIPPLGILAVVAGTLVLLLLLLAAVPEPGSAQARSPRRPSLDAGDDPRDWRSYYGCGIRASTYERARACLYWAERLDPTRAEPFYAEWMLSNYTSDSLRREAMLRDPFIFHGRVVQVPEGKYGVFTKPAARAWGGLGAGAYFEAARWFDKVIRSDPGDLEAHWGAALAQYYRGQFDSSALHVRALDEGLRRRRDRTVRRIHYTLDFTAYMEAVAWLSGGQRDSARAALERALTENLAFHPARLLLGNLALDRGDTAAADELWALGAELRERSALVRGQYGAYLLRRGRHADAERVLRVAIALEPDWVDARWDLARSLDAQGDRRTGDAAMELREFLARAPAADSLRRAQAAARLAALGPR